MKLSHYHVESPPLRDPTTALNCRAVFATRTATPIVLDEKSWQLVKNNRCEELPAQILNDLHRMELLIDEDQDELGIVVRRNMAAIRSDDTFYTVIQTTDACQLGCGYCGQKHGRTQLSDDDQSRIVQRAANALATGTYKAMGVCWFGGEPLLGMPSIRKLSPLLQKLAAQANCRYQAKVITNGILLKQDVVEELLRLGVHEIEITLDGDREYHDKRRHNKAGAPSFDVIWRNFIRIAADADITCKLSIRCNVDRRNLQGVVPLVRRIADAGLASRVNFYTASVYEWGGRSTSADALHPDEYATAEKEWLTELYNLGFPVNWLPQKRPIVCLAVMPNAKLIDAHGRLFNCTETSYVPEYGTPNIYQLGSLGANENSQKGNALSVFNDDVLARRFPCGDCRMLPVCGGACPKRWHEGTEPCPSTKRNIDWRLTAYFATTHLNS